MRDGRFEEGEFNRSLSTFVYVTLLIAIVTVGLIQLEGVLKPFFIALAIYFVLKPGADAISANGFPLVLSYLTVLLFFFLIVASAGYFAFTQAENLMSDEVEVEKYNTNLEEKWTWLRDDTVFSGAVVEWVGSENATLSEALTKVGLLADGGQTSDIVRNMLAGVGDMLASSLTILFFLIFMIFEASLLPGRIERAWPQGGSAKVAEVREQIEISVNTYVVVKTGVSLGTAGCAAILMILFDIDLWFTWAMLTFLFNYVPYIGSVFAMIPPVVLGIVVLEPGALIAFTVLSIVNQQLWGNYIENRWAGRALGISPVVLLLVTAYAFWVWGLVGMILAVPFAVLVKIVLENIDATKPVAILLSERAPSLDEAWEDAVRDGIISSFEGRSLLELQHLLEYTDDQVALIAARSSARRALKRGRVSQAQIDFLTRGLPFVNGDFGWVSELTPGKYAKERRGEMAALLEAFRAASERAERTFGEEA
ncbi:MAG: AI-2E family transporter [archaeon]|nr:AI-2E family transporter [archaeon]